MAEQILEGTYEMPDQDMVKTALESHYAEAEELLQDEDKLERMLQRLEKKLATAIPVPKVGELLSSVPTLISLVRSYAKKEYCEVPMASMIAIIAALAYFLAHIDLIPDIVPVAGLLDDVAVLYFALSRYDNEWASVITMAVIFLMRMLATKFRWSLPKITLS